MFPYSIGDHLYKPLLRISASRSSSHQVYEYLLGDKPI